MIIRITRIIIDNFRGIKHLDEELSKGLNIIQGYNGVGKTTVLSAITWCLFGKLYDERKTNIPLLPISSLIEDEKVETSVIVCLNNEHAVKRVFDGNKTTMFYGSINSDGEFELIESTITDFNEFFKTNYMDIEEFKTLSNLSYAVNLNWRDLKKIVFDVIGEVTSEDVYRIKEFPNERQSIELFGFEAFYENVKRDIKSTTFNIKNGEIALNNYNQIRYKYLSSHGDETGLINRRDDLKAQLVSYQKKIEENQELLTKRAELQQEIEDKTILLRSYINEIAEIDKEHFEFSSLYAENSSSNFEQKSQDLIDQREVLNEIELELMKIDSKIELKNGQLEDLKIEGNTLKHKEIKILNEKCELCGQTLPLEILEATLKRLKLEQQDELIEIKNRFDLVKKELEALGQQRKRISIRQMEEFTKLEEIKNKKYVGKNENDKAKEYKLKANELLNKKKKIEADKKETELEISNLKEKMKNLPEPEVLPNVELIQTELEEINERLASLTTLKSVEKDIKEQEDSITSYKLNLDLLNKKLLNLEEYNRIYNELVKAKVKKYFKTVEFITEEYTKEGKLVETFKISKDGVPYIELNTAMKIEVALDLLNGIQMRKDIKAPILIDNCESIIDLPILKTQMIVAKCIVQDEKKIEIVKEDSYGKEEQN